MVQGVVSYHLGSKSGGDGRWRGRLLSANFSGRSSDSLAMRPSHAMYNMRFVVFSSVALCILTPPPPILLRSILSSTDSADEDPEVEVDAPAGGNGGIASTVRWVHQTKGFFRLYSRTTFISFPSIIILFVAPVNSMAHRRMCVFFFHYPVPSGFRLRAS